MSFSGYKVAVQPESPMSTVQTGCLDFSLADQCHNQRIFQSWYPEKLHTLGCFWLPQPPPTTSLKTSLQD